MLLVPAGNPSVWTGPTGNNTYLLTGAIPTLVDAGVGEASHVAAVERGLDGADLAVILVTHTHSDHVKGIPALLDRWPGAIVRNVPPDSCRDEEMIRAGDTVLRAIHTPGHAPDHFCFLDETTRDVYCGDLARLGGTIVIPASSGGNLTHYLASLGRIRALGPRRLLPGHGAIVERPAALIDEYRAHRAERERQIVECLERGCTSVEEIVANIYRQLPAASALVRAASDSVLAHLIKLRDDGRAVERDGGWRLL
jgi:glyoxylase-like metal-dependent hydrolase (beta-lactamase superfamily II)